MEKLRLEKEEKAKKDAKKAALNSRLAAFGGKSKADEEKRQVGKQIYKGTLWMNSAEQTT
jgi:hypothetical protein